MEHEEFIRLRQVAEANSSGLDKPAHKLFLGSKFTAYLNLDDKTIEIEPRDPHCEEDGLIISIPISCIIKVGKVKWNKKDGEKFEDVTVKKPPKEIIFDIND